MEQRYSDYTREHFDVWRILFNRQLQNLTPVVAKKYLDGLQKINFHADKIPDFAETNTLLEKLTGWHVKAVPGIIPDKDFFLLLNERKFPATCWLRKMDQLDYIEEPDMFHDVFGHIPLLTDKHYCEFLVGLSEIVLPYIDNSTVVHLMSRIYWFTIEFGLKLENGKCKIYGAGIISSSGETEYSMSYVPTLYPYEVTKLFATPYYKDHIQDKYFVVQSFEELYNSLPAIKAYIELAALQQ